MPIPSLSHRCARPSHANYRPKKEKKKLTEAPLDDRVDALETRRGQLLTQRAQLERKLAELRRKMADEPEGRDAGAGSGDGGK